jgi:type IV pilus assembly protein PilQ
MTQVATYGLPTWLARLGAALWLMMAGGVALAQDNAIEAITANQQGSNVVINIAMKHAPAKAPIGFSITNPARIALDFGATANDTGKNGQDINLGDVRGANVVQAGERTRVVLNLKRPLNYATAIDGKSIIVTVEGTGGVAQAVNAAGMPAVKAEPAVEGRQALKDLDFRRGPNGDGRIVVDLPNSQVPVDVRQVGNQVIVDFMNTSLPPTLRRRLDVTDFGTPVTKVTAAPQGDNVHLTIDAQGLWEQSVYQSDTQLVVDVRPVKENPNKLAQGNGGYRGEKVSFNFQNVEVRAVLQAIADVSGINIITGDSVGGTLTLRLKEVPWDQALDMILQYKGLDMRKNGNVMWIAPKEEILTKEKLELEQRAQIADLEPLRSEVFVLNYQKVDAVRAMLYGGMGGNAGAGAAAGAGAGSNGGGNGGAPATSPAGGAGGANGAANTGMLSKRGSVIADVRTNQLFVTDIASRLEDIRQLIQKVDIATKQVLVEARIVEANDGFSRNLGAKLGFSDMRTIRGGDSGYQIGNTNNRVAVAGNLTGIGQVTGQVGNAADSFNNMQFVNLPANSINGVTAPSLAFSLFSPAANRFLNLELSALEADGKGQIVSSPRVMTEDKHVAVIEQGVELPYSSSAGFGASPTVTFKKANLRLEVTPQITPDGNVVLDVDVSKDSKGESTASGFAINNQHVNTRTMVENGGTVVLGGVYQQTDNNSTSKVPFLGDVPLFGYLFKNTAHETTKTELLIFITPKIVTDKLATAR